MFAVIRTGGKQYKVEKNAVLKIERMTTEVGDNIHFDHVLLFDDGVSSIVGSPLVTGVTVTAKVVEHFRTDKVLVFKKKARANYRRKFGHRQDMTKIIVTDIKVL